MDKIEVKSCAKINFGLRILEKREDGFHNLQTLFIPTPSFYDLISFEKASTDSFSSNVKELDNDFSNLIIRAKSLIERESDLRITVNINLKKNIPIGAGLGGGSSNAAFTLIALNDLFELNVSQSKLREIALDLGSDVPFFLNAKPAIGTSRGEILERLELDIFSTILLINPGIHISTKEAFSNIVPTNVKIDYYSLITNNKLDFKKSRKIVQNGFESYIFEKYPIIQSIRNDLYKYGAEFSQMSGTGSTVYGFFDNLLIAEEAASKFPESFSRFILE